MSRTVHKPRRRRGIRSPRVLDRRGQVWENLLAVAGRLMAESGVETVSVEQILLAAGLSRGTFYGFCAGKSDLVVAIVEPALREGAARLAELAAAPATEIVPGITQLYVDLWRRRREALLLIPTVDAVAFERLRGAHEDYTAALKTALARAERGGYLRNGSAAYTFRVIARTAVPLMRVYEGHPDGERLYRESMHSLLSAPRDRPVRP